MKLGPALASVEPDWKHFCRAALSGVQKFLMCINQGIMTEICDIKKAKPETEKGDTRISPSETSIDSTIKHNKSKNYNPR